MDGARASFRNYPTDPSVALRGQRRQLFVDMDTTLFAEAYVTAGPAGIARARLDPLH
jgi:hypothetical protein